MAEQEICSPVSRPGSKVGSGQPHAPRRAQQSFTWTHQLYSRAAVMWSEPPQRGAGRKLEPSPGRYNPSGWNLHSIDSGRRLKPILGSSLHVRTPTCVWASA